MIAHTYKRTVVMHVFDSIPKEIFIEGYDAIPREIKFALREILRETYIFLYLLRS